MCSFYPVYSCNFINAITQSENQNISDYSRQCQCSVVIVQLLYSPVYLVVPHKPVQLVNFLYEILVAYSYSIHYQPIGGHLSSIEEENNFGQISIL